MILVIDESNLRKSVLKLSAPSVAEQTLFMVVGVVSTIFVGQINKEAVSAVGLINVLVNFIMVLFVAVSTGSTVLVARLIGEGDTVKAQETVKQSVVLGALMSLISSILCYIFAVPLINVFFSNAETDVVHMADIYFKITMYTFPLTLINIIINGTLRGAGDTKTPMLIANIVNILNVVLNWILIFGISFGNFKLGGFGFIGAAWAVTISRGIGGLLSIGALYLPDNKVRTDIFRRFNVDLDIIKRVFKIGIPAALEQIVMQGGFLVLQIFISSLGTVAIAVYQICMSINSISFIPMWGFGIAVTTMVGQCLGAKKPQAAEKSGWETLKIGMVVTLFLTLLLFIFAGSIIAIYNRDPEVIHTGTTAIRIFCLSQPFLSIVVVFSGALRGAGDIKYVMITSFVGIWVFRIALTLILGTVFRVGFMGVWIALFFDFFIRSIMYTIRFKHGRWKEIVV